MSGAIAVVLVLGALVFVHELGHFLAARLLGIGVRVVSLGFGPVVARLRLAATEYRLSLVPLGGYVTFSSNQNREEADTRRELRENFDLRPPWQRMLVIAAGPLANFLLAFVICWGLFWVHGLSETLPEVGGVMDGGPAAIAGVLPGDRVVELDGERMEYWSDVAARVEASKGRSLSLRIERDGVYETIVVTPRSRIEKNLFGRETEAHYIGISSSGRVTVVPLDLASSARVGLEQTWNIVVATGQALAGILSRAVPMDSIGGPITIATTVNTHAHEGMTSLLALTIVISVNLGLLNLLPIPVLDGGYLFLFAYESLAGRPVPPRAQKIAFRIGLAILLCLVLWGTINDLGRL